MKAEELSDPLVRSAVAALNSGDPAAWLDLFTSDATLTDDGRKQNFVNWSDSEIFGREHEENHGLTVYGTFRSAQWGAFETFFKFHESTGKLSGLDLAQVNSD